MNNTTVPIHNKYALTVEEMAVYSGIGENKLRQLIKANPGEKWMLTIGTRTLIKRELFVRYLDKQTEL